jgi:hypothetical protein
MTLPKLGFNLLDFMLFLCIDVESTISSRALSHFEREKLLTSSSSLLESSFNSVDSELRDSSFLGTA